MSIFLSRLGMRRRRNHIRGQFAEWQQRARSRSGLLSISEPDFARYRRQAL